MSVNRGVQELAMRKDFEERGKEGFVLPMSTVSMMLTEAGFLKSTLITMDEL